MLRREIEEEQPHWPVLVGSPDSGKSVILHQFAQSLNDKHPIPIWVDVRGYRASERLEDFIWSWFYSDTCPGFYQSIRGSLKHYMKSGEVLWLLDGIEAGSPEDFRARLQRVRDFKNNSPANRGVVTSRYDFGLPNDIWPILFRLRELDDGHIDRFIQKVGTDSNLATLKSRRDLLDLCRNPGGLVKLAGYWNRNNSSFPSHIGHLYKELWQDLIERAAPPGPEVPLVLDLLSKIALTMAEQGRNGSDIPRADLRTRGVVMSPQDEGRIDSSVSGGLLTEDTRTDHIRFVDYKFEEYLAARALEHRLRSDGPGAIAMCLSDYVLRETLANAVAISDNASELVDQIVNHVLLPPQQIESIISAAECIRYATPTLRERYGFKLLPQLRRAASPYGKE
jgi:hypothetical protein